MALIKNNIFLNPYEQLHSAVRNNPLFDEASWKKAADTSSLEQYSIALNNTKGLDSNKFYKDYNLDFSSVDTRMNALYNEAFASREPVKREIEKYNSDGTKYVETVEMSDYDYYKEIIKIRNDQMMQDYYSDLAQQFKDEQSFIIKALGTIHSPLTALTRGVTSGINDIIEFLGAFTEGTVKSIANKEDWAKSVGEVLSTDRYRPFQFLEDATIEFETNYSALRDADGNYNDVGTVILGGLDSIGKMVPSAVLAYFTGGSSALLKSAISMGTFYLSSEFAQSYEQHYEQAIKDDLDVDYLRMMATDAAVAAGKAAISIALSKIMGGTYVKNKAFGLKNNVKGLSEGTKDIVRYIQTLGGDALEEGIDEVLQDSLEVLAYNVQGGDYAKLSSLSFEDFVITFLSAALTSVVGGSFGTLTGKKLETADGKKLSKISSFLVNCDLQTVVDTFENSKNYINKIKDTLHVEKDKYYKKYEKSAMSAYKSLRVMNSIFGEIGEKRTTEILNALNRISDVAKRGLFDKDTAKARIGLIVDSIAGSKYDKSLYAELGEYRREKFANELERAAITEMVNTVDRGDKLESLEMSKETEDKLNELANKTKNDKKKTKIHIAKDGKDIVVNETKDASNVVIPENILENVDSTSIYKSIVYKKFVDELCIKFAKDACYTDIKTLHEKYSLEKRTDSEIINELINNSYFFTEVMFDGNENSKKFVLSLIEEFGKTITSKEFSNTEEKQYYINFYTKSVEKMVNSYVEYAKQSPDADYNLPFLNDKQRNEIVNSNPRLLLYKAYDVNYDKYTEFNDVYITNVKYNHSKLNDFEKKYVYNFVENNKKYVQTVNKVTDIQQLSTLNKMIDTKIITRQLNHLHNDTSPKRNYNRYMDSLKLNLSNIYDDSYLTVNDRSAMESMQLDIVAYRKYQFENTCNNIFTIVPAVKNGKFDIDKTKILYSEVYDDYFQDVEKVKSDRKSLNFDDKVATIKSANKLSLLRLFIDKNINDNDLIKYSINDVITKPNLLDKDLYNDLFEKGIITQSTYGDVVNEPVLMKYLREIVVEKSNGDSSLIQLSTGEYSFADIVPIKNIVNIKDLIKDYSSFKDGTVVKLSKYLKHPYKNINTTLIVKNLHDVDFTGFSQPELNSIVVNLGTDAEYFSNTVAHEFVHILQYVNKMTAGFDPVAFYNTYENLSKQKKKQFYEHVVDSFSPYVKNLNKYNTDEKVIRKTLISLGAISYFASGEIYSYGLKDYSYGFLPIITDGHSVTLPNGNKINLVESKSWQTYKDSYYTGAKKVETFLDLQKDKSYQDTKDLYSYLVTKDNIYKNANITYKNMYIDEYDTWSKMYEDAFNNFANMKSQSAISAYVTGAKIDANYDYNIELKENMMGSITAEDRQTMLHLAHVQVAPELTYEEFLDTEIPFVRVQRNREVISEDVVSISAGSFASASFAKILYDNFARGENYAIIGKIKPSQFMAYINPNEFEAIINSSDLRNATLYEVNIQKDGVLVYDIEGDNVQFADDTFSYHPKQLSDEELNKAMPKRPGSKYLERIFKDGKPRYKQPYTRRYISDKLAGDTNLKYYKGDQLAEDFQKFVVKANDKNAKMYIGDIKKGKLRRKDVLYDFTFGKIEDEATFKLINDCFYNNSNIKSLKQLDKLILSSGQSWALDKLLNAIKKSTGEDYTHFLELDADINSDVLNILFNDKKNGEKYQKIYEGLLKSYEETGNKVLTIDENYLRVLYMRRYDGSIYSAKKVASLARTMSIADFVSVPDEMSKGSRFEQGVKNKKTGESNEMTLGDQISNDAATDLDEIIEGSVQKMRNAIIEDFTKKFTDLSKDKRFNKKAADAYALNYLKKVKEASDATIIKIYRKMFVNELKAEYEVIDVDNAEDSKVDDLFEITKRKAKTDARNLSRAISHQINTIKRNLNAKDVKRFLKYNSDIFNDDLSLKDEVLHNKDAKGRTILKSVDELKSVKDRINDLSKDTQAGLYKTAKGAEFAIQHRKDMQKVIKQNIDKISKVSKDDTSKNSKKSLKENVTFVENDKSLTVTVDRNVPEKLKQLLSYSLTKKADTTVKYLSGEDEKHVVMSMKKFVEDNTELLSTMSENEAYDIADFLLNSNVVSSDSIKYNSMQLTILSYIYTSARDGIYNFEQSLIDAMLDKIKYSASNAGTQLATWNTVMERFKPREILSKSILDHYGVDISTSQITRLSRAVEDYSNTGNIEAFNKVKKEIYDDIIYKNSKEGKLAAKKQFDAQQAALIKAGVTSEKTLNKSKKDLLNERKIKSKLDTMFNKLWNIERTFMLSSPGTWVRNYVSNSMIGGLYVKDRQITPGLNDVSGKLGSLVSKILPKKWKKQNQWKIVGTKVSSDVIKYIKDVYIDSGLINMIGDSMNKYDLRKSNKSFSAADTFSELIVRKLAQDMFNENHKFSAFFGKLLSDDKAIMRQTIKYFGKMLTETKVNMKTVSFDYTTKIFVEAYIMAANDFMHKTNFIHSLEKIIHEKGGDTAYFMYKQFFPFASSSLNWFGEGLRYTPYGLIKGIINFANLERKIEKLEDARLRGERVPSSKFAQYISIRDIGKGTIGTAGLLAAMLLGLSGIVKIDNDDDEYKLKVGNVSVDISDVFGTQGILMGICITQGIKDEKTFWNITKETCDLMFNDSLYTSVLDIFRYGGSISDNFERYMTYNIPNMFIPNFIKTFTSIARKYDVKYDKGVLGNIEKLVVNAVPFIDRAFPHSYDVYTGKESAKYRFSDYAMDTFNRLSPVKINNYEMSPIEAYAINLGLNKTELTGRYEIDGEKISLRANQVAAINKLYGTLNNKDLTDFMGGKTSYKVQDENGKYRVLTFGKMTDKQKAATFERIMSKNSGFVKIYSLTNSGKYKYYASESEYIELKKLGITKNVYKKVGKKEGFVKSN